jgi:hypothetical protein
MMELEKNNINQYFVKEVQDNKIMLLFEGITKQEKVL